MFNIPERIEHFLFDVPKGPAAVPLKLPMRILRYAYALVRDLFHGDLNLRAMSLVYTTLMSVVPLLAFSFSILKGMGVHRDLEPLIYEFLRPVGGKATELTAQVMSFVENVRSGVLGSLGLAFLLFTVVSTVQKVEGSLNFVWHVERPRSFARRVTEYLSLMIVGPIAIVAGVGLMAAAADTAIIEKLASFAPISAALLMLGRIVPYLLVSGLFTFLYMFIPNTRVYFVPALIGGLVAGILWALVGAAFTAFVTYSARLTLIYTSFAILITALIWIYVAWLILLVGGQLSFYVQNPQYLRRGQQQMRLTASLAERLALNTMLLVGRSFRKGENKWTVNRLAVRLDVPSALLAPVIRSLEGAGLLLATEEEELVPGRDMAQIDMHRIIAAARDYHRGEPSVHVHGTPVAEQLSADIDQALHSALGNKTLSQLVDEGA